MTTTAGRRRNADERRRELCDAAMQVLAEHGSRGLSHQRVDRSAGMPDGTTSYYYRTRAALLHGVAERVAEIDTANLMSVCDEAPQPDSPFHGLAKLVVAQAGGPGLALNKARHELLLAATRDPALAEFSRDFAQRILSVAHEAIAARQPEADDPALRAAQTTAVMTFISGVFTRYVNGDRSLSDPAELERLLQAIVVGIAVTAAEPSR
jgi:DNA-binding transcriptional regulator YbjK